MKIFILAALLLFLLMPAPGFGDEVKSRYDVTFGGFIKFDAGWSSKNFNSDPSVAPRESGVNYSVLADEYSNTFMSGGSTRFNFLISGPDFFGGRTSGFIEGDFRGTATGNSYGGFQLRNAFLKINWRSTEFMVGQNWQQWGMPYYATPLGDNDFMRFLRGKRLPQASIRYFFTKEWNVMFGVAASTNWAGRDWRGPGTPDSRQQGMYSASNWPGFMAEIAWWPDRWGKIGSTDLRFGLGSYYGRERPIGENEPDESYFSDRLNVWITAFRYSVPIVPEKDGDKSNALLLGGNVFIGQNVAGNNWMGGANTSMGSYERPDENGDFAAPTLFGLFAQLSWWLTNNVSINGMYGYLRYNYSEWARTNSVAARNRLSMEQQYAINILWDANQAVRLGIQWMTMFTRYGGKRIIAGAGDGLAGSGGSIEQYRFAAWYFF